MKRLTAVSFKTDFDEHGYPTKQYMVFADGGEDIDDIEFESKLKTIMRIQHKSQLLGHIKKDEETNIYYFIDETRIGRMVDDNGKNVVLKVKDKEM